MRSRSRPPNASSRSWLPDTSPACQPRAWGSSGNPPTFFGCGSGLDETAADRVARQCDAVAQAELEQDVRAVSLDRLFADDEGLGDLAARVAVSDQLDDLAFAPGQRVLGRAAAVLATPEEISHVRRHCRGI